MEIISKDILKEIKNGTAVSGTSVSGVILVTAYSIALTKNGKEYVAGTMIADISVPFKARGNSNAFTKLKTEEYSNIPVYIVGTVDNYNGTSSIIVSDISAVADFKPEQFLEQKYNTDAYYEALMKLIRGNVSDNAMKIVDNVFSNSELLEHFKVEFAATSHHDNCKGGLLAHTYKCVSLLNWALTTNPVLLLEPDDLGVLTKENQQARKDLLFLGMLFHDIGKVREMSLGIYQNCSKVTHRYLGIEFIYPFKDMIIDMYSEAWYYDLISILLQHHGEYGDPCKTVVSFIISKVDLFESQMTLLSQTLSNKVTRGSSGCRINIDGTYLSVN